MYQLKGADRNEKLLIHQLSGELSDYSVSK